MKESSILETILLGTGGMMPMPYRLLTSLAVRLNGEIYLFDAGESTQLGLKKAKLGVRGLRLIAVSHLHADHCLGLPGLLMLKAQMENPPPLTILGPPGIEEFVIQNQRIMEFYLNYPLRFIEWREEASELAYEDEWVRILWHPLQHTRFCLGFRLEEHERPGKFDPKRAQELRMPRGPLWGKLQRGESVMDDTGAVVSAEQVLGTPRRGRHVAYVVDTRPTKAIYRLLKDVDIAFIEGMFMPEDSQHAEAKGHMTITDGARIARRAGARRAVLIHISPRYGNEELDRLDGAAKVQFAEAVMGRELEIYPVPYVE
jgi:ribonuclease Z